MGQRKSRTKRTPRRKDGGITTDKTLRVGGLRVRDQYRLYRSLLYAYDLCEAAEAGPGEKALRARALRDLESMIELSRRVVSGLK